MGMKTNQEPYNEFLINASAANGVLYHPRLILRVFSHDKSHAKKYNFKLLVMTLLKGDQNKQAKGASVSAPPPTSLKGTVSSREQGFGGVLPTPIHPHGGSKILGTSYFDIYPQTGPFPRHVRRFLSSPIKILRKIPC